MGNQALPILADSKNSEHIGQFISLSDCEFHRAQCAISILNII